MGHAESVSRWPALDALVANLVDTRAQIAALQAAEARVLAASVDLVTERMEQRRLSGERITDADLPLREVALELGLAMRLSDRAVQARMGDAALLAQRFTQTLDAWESGRIDAGHAWAIVRAGVPIADEERSARFERLALEAAQTESAGRMPQVAKAIAAAVDPEAFAARLRDAAEDRRIRLYDLEDGLARLVADLPAALAYGIFDRLTQIAAVVQRNETTTDPEAVLDAEETASGDGETASGDGETASGDGDDAREGAVESIVTGSGSRPTRTIDQIRADLVSDLLLSGTPSCHGDGLGAVTGHIQVTVPAFTLAGADDQPPLLAGYGPIDPMFAQRLAALAPGWDRVFTDPYSGLPLAVDRYRPTAPLHRYLDARDERCRTPACPRLAKRCDVDHTIDAARGGPTEAENLAHFCRRHHVDKHHTSWRVRQLGGGVIEWTGPTGRRYVDRPPATVRFVPVAEDPAPF